MKQTEMGEKMRHLMKKSLTEWLTVAHMDMPQRKGKSPNPLQLKALSLVGAIPMASPSRTTSRPAPDSRMKKGPTALDRPRDSLVGATGRTSNEDRRFSRSW